MTPTLFAITIKPPWTEFILGGIKTLDNRSWGAKYTGPLLIHASQSYDHGWEKKLESAMPLEEAKRYLRQKIIGGLGRISFHHGCLVGAVNMVGCDEVSNSPWCQFGFFYHRYTNPYRLLKPVKVTGNTKIYRPKVFWSDFKAEADIVELMGRQGIKRRAH